MDNPVATALAITVVGMTLLFLTLVFFYGLMVLITSVLKDPVAVPEHPAGDSEVRSVEQEAMLRAAAIAVAMARAEAQQGGSLAAIPVEAEGDDLSPTSPWWMLHHQHRLRSDPNARRLP